MGVADYIFFSFTLVKAVFTDLYWRKAKNLPKSYLFVCYIMKKFGIFPAIYTGENHQNLPKSYFFVGYSILKVQVYPQTW